MSTGLLLVGHGSSDGGSQLVVRELAQQVSMLASGLESTAAFLDHDELTPALGLRILAANGCTDAVVVPVLLNGAFHVFEDLPQQLDGALRTRITAHLGPDPRVVAAVADRLPATVESVVLCAPGSKDERVIAEVSTAAQLLGDKLQRPVRPAFLGSYGPSLEAVAAELSDPTVAPYLLANGLFATQLDQRCTAMGLQHCEVIGAHPQLVVLIAERVRDAIR